MNSLNRIPFEIVENYKSVSEAYREDPSFLNKCRLESALALLLDAATENQYVIDRFLRMMEERRVEAC